MEWLVAKVIGRQGLIITHPALVACGQVYRPSHTGLPGHPVK